MSEFTQITDDGDRLTSPMPKAGTVVEVQLRNGSIIKAFYDQNIMEVVDFDFIPLNANGEADLEADSIVDQVVAWRATTPRE